jgi:transcriptional regulator with XRE-family HTH domain
MVHTDASIFSNYLSPGYIEGMQTGRPSLHSRSPFGERLHALRERMGLSQQQVAERIGMSSRAYAHWERRPVAFRPEQLQGLADALKVSVDELLGKAPKKKRGNGPAGKLRQAFESASTLPRSQQRKIMELVELFVMQHASKQSAAA